MYQRLLRDYMADGSWPKEELDPDGYEQHWDDARDLEEEIYATPALTADGLLAKLNLMLRDEILDGFPVNFDRWQQEKPTAFLHQAMVSLWIDLHHLKGVRVVSL